MTDLLSIIDATYGPVMMGCAVALGSVVLLIYSASRDRNFLRTRYWTYFAVFALNAVGAPIYVWMRSRTPYELSDVYLLRAPNANWGNVLVGYAVFVGVVFGGTVAALLRRYWWRG